MCILKYQEGETRDNCINFLFYIIYIYPLWIKVIFLEDKHNINVVYYNIKCIYVHLKAMSTFVSSSKPRTYTFIFQDTLLILYMHTI